MGIFTKNKEKMDILQKTQENLELTQKNLSLLAAQNQESISENQEVLQRTLTSIEAMLGKKNESVPCKKEYSPEEKKRAAYALNCCTISVSQIVDYDDIYVLEQEYEAILNNLNLENMPKDEALLDIYKQLLDTITFFRNPKDARYIAYEICDFFADKYQIVFGIHSATNLHIHFVVNSVSFRDGSRFINNNTSLNALKKHISHTITLPVALFFD